MARGTPAELQDTILKRAVLRTFAKGQMVQIEDGPPIGLGLQVADRQICVLDAPGLRSTVFDEREREPARSVGRHRPTDRPAGVPLDEVRRRPSV